MKKVVAWFAVLTLLLGLMGCADAVTIGGFASKYLDSEEYDEAVQQFMTAFKDLEGFEGCTLKKVGYGGDAAVKAEAEARDLAKNHLIVLTSTFETDGENRQNGLEPNHTYEEDRWILTRESAFDPFWEIVDHGLGEK